MNESELQAQSRDGIPPPPAGRRRWVSVLLFAVVFVCGIICGAGVTAVAVARAAREAVQHPERRPERAARWLARRLRLSEQQTDQVRNILQEQNADFAGLRKEVWPRVTSRLEKTETEVARILTPEQQKKWRKLIEELRTKWLPPDPSPATPAATPSTP